MKLEWMMLTNHAEVRDGLLYISGGGWDTINVQSRPPDAPENVFATMVGVLAVRLLFHVTETNRDHEAVFVVIDEDGTEIAKSANQFPVERQADVPAGWLQNVNIVAPVTGVPLPRPGLYTLALTVNGQWMGDRPFRVLQQF